MFKKLKFGVLAMLIANGILLLAIPVSRELVKLCSCVATHKHTHIDYCNEANYMKFLVSHIKYIYTVL